MSAISASPVEPAILPFGSLEWFKRELAPTPDARSPNSDYGRCRSVVRDHFHDAAGAGAVCHRLHAFLHVKGKQASHDTYRSHRAYRPDHRHRRESPTLQVHLWSSRTAHPRNGNRALSWNVAVPRFCDRATRIPHRFCCRLLRNRSEKQSPPLNSWFEDFFGSGWPSPTAQD